MDRLDLSETALMSSETLCSYVQKVYFKSKKGEEKTKMLRITIELKYQSKLSLGNALCLEITDDTDSMFLYSLILTQDDFSILKVQQGLLVDFDNFPAQLIKLLENCMCQDVSNKFILVLDESDIATSISQDNSSDCFYLKVIEINFFKNLCHLSLKVKQGSDADVKKHMSIKINTLNDKLQEEIKKKKKCEASLNNTLRALDVKAKELTELQIKIAEEKNNLKFETSQQISEEREKSSKLQLEWQQRLEIEKSELTTKFQKQITDLNEQINLLSFNNKNLYESKCHFETCVKEKIFHIEALDKQILQITQELSFLKKQSSQMDQEYHEKDKAVVTLKTKLAVAEQELKDKEKYIEKQQELLKVASEQKSFLEEALSEKENHLLRKQAAVQTLSSDLMKSNEIISKLQSDLASNKVKMKLRTDIALEQEKVLIQKTEEIETQSKMIDELQKKVDEVSSELLSVKSHFEDAMKQIEDQKVTIKKNDNVINWLNKRLTECNLYSVNSTNQTSSRTDSESTLEVTKSKGNISNLLKGWPPWLVNSVTGYNVAQNDSAGMPNYTNDGSLSQNRSVNIVDSNPSNTQTSKLDEKKKIEVKSCCSEVINDAKPKGLDPKYFQSSVDKEFMTNAQILRNRGSAKTNSKSLPKPTSAYFPTKHVPL